MKAAPPNAPTLRDIHVPDPSWWPPAPGWWVLIVLVVLLLVALLWWLRKRIRRQSQLRALESELSSIEERFKQDEDKVRLASALSQLVRRATLSRGGKAQLRGDPWRVELQRLAPACMQEQNVAVLDSAPYQRQADFDAQALIQDCRRWLRLALVRRDG